MCKAKLFARLICILFFLSGSLQFSAQNDTITYISKFDSCHIFQILPDGNVFMPSGCGHTIDFIGGYRTGAGIDHKGRAVFQKRRESTCQFTKDEEVVRLYFENTDILWTRFSLINRDSFIIITGLKSGPGIDCHYSGTTVYERSDKKGCFQPNPHDRPLEIFIENYKHNTHMQLAMDQHFVEGNMNVDSSKVMIKNGQFGKTHRRSNPEDLVSGKYNFYKVDRDDSGNLIQEALPAIFATMPSVYLPLEDRNKAFERYWNIIGDSRYFISYSRFNPGRDYVNKTFSEDMEGNVLSFMLYSVEEYLKE